MELLYLLVIVLVVAGIFAAIRAIVLWYLRLDEIAQNLISITKNTALTVTTLREMAARLEAQDQNRSPSPEN